MEIVILRSTATKNLIEIEILRFAQNDVRTLFFNNSYVKILLLTSLGKL